MKMGNWKTLGGLLAGLPETIVDLAKLEQLSMDELERVAGGTLQTAGDSCGGYCQTITGTNRGVFTQRDDWGGDCD